MPQLIDRNFEGIGNLCQDVEAWIALSLAAKLRDVAFVDARVMGELGLLHMEECKPIAEIKRELFSVFRRLLVIDFRHVHMVANSGLKVICQRQTPR